VSLYSTKRISFTYYVIAHFVLHFKIHGFKPIIYFCEQYIARTFTSHIYIKINYNTFVFLEKKGNAPGYNTFVYMITNFM
jgi:hypothetical protein